MMFQLPEIRVTLLVPPVLCSFQYVFFILTLKSRDLWQSTVCSLLFIARLILYVARSYHGPVGIMHLQVATGSAETSSKLFLGGVSSRKSGLPVRFRLESFKVSRIFGTRVSNL